MGRKSAVAAWLGVALVGVIIVGLVLGLQLFPRLNAAQNLINDARPAFTADRVAGDRAAINMVSTTVDAFDPAVTAKGGASSEVPKLVAFVAQQTGLSQAQVLSTLQQQFPHTTGLLTALPLSDVSAELPQLVSFLATTLKLTPDQVMATLKANFPHLYQAIQNLPAVTSGWDSVPGTLTRFDGTRVTTVPQARDYFSSDVIPVLERQNGNFRGLDSYGGVAFLTPLLLVVGIAVILFGAAMAWGSARGLSSGVAAVGWSVVTIVGVVVIVLVFALNLFPRLSGGQKLLDDIRPAFTAERVAGDRAAIDLISRAVDTVDPIATPAGGASSEVPKLVAFVSKQTGLSEAAVLSTLQEKFPHTTGLLNAIPLSNVTAEFPKLIPFLASTLKLSNDQVAAALKSNFPHLNQAIQNLPVVVSAWNDVAKAQPDITKLSRFDGAPVKTVPEIRDYFISDVIPVLERQQRNFQKVDTTWPRLTVFAPLLLVVGILVTLYGLLFFSLTRRQMARSKISRKDYVLAS